MSSRQNVKDYREAVAEVLQYFDREHEAAMTERIREMAKAALAGDLWVLAQLHLAAIDGNHFAREAFREFPELQRMVEEPTGTAR